jgi:hypothetical protein
MNKFREFSVPAPGVDRAMKFQFVSAKRYWNILESFKEVGPEQ